MSLEFNYIFDVPNIRCASCTGIIDSLMTDKTIEETTADGKKKTVVTVKKLSSDVTIKTVSLTVASEKNRLETETLLKKEFEDIGFNAFTFVKLQSITWPVIAHVLQGILGLVASVGLMALMMMGITLAPWLLYLIAGVSVGLTLLLGREIYYEAGKKLFKTRKLTMDSLFSISTLAAIGVSIAALFVPGLPMIFDTALMIIAFWHIGRAVDKTARYGLVKSLKFGDRAPKKVIQIAKDKQGKENKEEIDARTLEVNDEFELLAGDCLPVNSYCRDQVWIYDTLITGDANARQSKPEEKLKAGTKTAKNSGTQRFVVTEPYDKSYLALLDKTLEDAQEKKAPIEKTADKMLQYFIPAVLMVAGGCALVVGVFFSPVMGIYSAISVLVSACPCILGFIVPLSIKIGLTKASEHGAYFKNGDALQKAGDIDTVVFDLNGTLTKGEPNVNQVVTYPAIDKSRRFTKKKLLAYFAAMESDSKHAIGKAIVRYNNKQFKRGSLPLVTEREEKGYGGVSGIIDGQKIVVGNASMLKDLGIVIPVGLSKAEHIIFLACDGVVVGQVTLADQLRDDAMSVIAALKKQGKKIRICTGAPRESALGYARALGIADHEVQADCVPICDGLNGLKNRMTKTAYIEALKAKGHQVAMIGDSGNDANAMMRADLGIAVQSPSMDEMTCNNAGVVVRGSLVPIPTLFVLAKEAISGIHQNLGLSLSYNIAAMFVTGFLFSALGLMVPPALGVVLMIAQSMIIMGSAYYFKYTAVPPLPPVALPEMVVKEKPWQVGARRVLDLVREQYLATHEIYQAHHDLYEAIDSAIAAEKDPQAKQLLENHAKELMECSEKSLTAQKPLGKKELERFAKTACAAPVKKHHTLVVAITAVIGALAALTLCVAGGLAVGAAVGVMALGGSLTLAPAFLVTAIMSGVGLKAGLTSSAACVGAMAGLGAGVWTGAAAAAQITLFGTQKNKRSPEKKVLDQALNRLSASAA